MLYGAAEFVVVVLLLTVRLCVRVIPPASLADVASRTTCFQTGNNIFSTTQDNNNWFSVDVCLMTSGVRQNDDSRGRTK